MTLKIKNIIFLILLLKKDLFNKNIKNKIMKKIKLHYLITSILLFSSLQVNAIEENKEIKNDETLNFSNFNPRINKLNSSSSLGKEHFIIKNEFQEIRIDKNIDFNQRLNYIEQIQEAKLIGQIKIENKQNGKFNYSGVYGDIVANTFEDLIKQKENNKKFLFKKIKDINNIQITFAKNAQKYESVLDKNKIEYIGKKIRKNKEDKISLILFEPHLNNKKNKLYVMSLKKDNKEDFISIKPLENYF